MTKMNMTLFTPPSNPIVGYRRRWAPEFGTPPVAATVVLFAVNNIWMKRAWPSWTTGKLSDLLAAFFLPLFISAVLHLCGVQHAKARIGVGASITAIVFTLVKTNEAASHLLDAVLRTLAAPTGVILCPNVVDPSDLVALLMIPLSVLYGMYRIRKFGETP